MVGQLGISAKLQALLALAFRCAQLNDSSTVHLIGLVLKQWLAHHICITLFSSNGWHITSAKVVIGSSLDLSIHPIQIDHLGQAFDLELLDNQTASLEMTINLP